MIKRIKRMLRRGKWHTISGRVTPEDGAVIYVDGFAIGQVPPNVTELDDGFQFRVQFREP